MRFEEAEAYLVGDGLPCPSCEDGRVEHPNEFYKVRCTTCGGSARVRAPGEIRALAIYLRGLIEKEGEKEGRHERAS